MGIFTDQLNKQLPKSGVFTDQLKKVINVKEPGAPVAPKVITPPVVTKKPFASTNVGIVANTVTGIPRELLKLGKDIVQSIPRSILSTALTIAPKGVQEKIGEINPREDMGKVGQTLLGKEPIRTIPKTGSSMLESFGISPEKAKTFGPIVGLGLTGLDLYPGTSGKGKIVKKGVEEALIKKAVKLSEEGIPLALNKAERAIVDNIPKKTLPSFIPKKTPIKVIDDLYTAPKETKNNLFKQAIAPVKNLDDTSKNIMNKWNADTINAKVASNQRIGTTGVKGLDEIINYQKGIVSENTSKIKGAFDELFNKANKAGVETEYKQNYLPGVYKGTDKEIQAAINKYLKKSGMTDDQLNAYVNGRALSNEEASRLGVNPSFTKEKIFPNYEVAAQYGLKPKYTNVDQLLANYDEQLGKTIANRTLVDELAGNGKILQRPLRGMVPLNPEFSQVQYYAEPKLAKVINGLFNPGTKGLIDTTVEGISKGSKFLQSLRLSAGLPFTTANFYAVGQLVKEITSMNFKAVNSFFRANFNKTSMKWLKTKIPVMKRMANQNIDMSKTLLDSDDMYKTIIKDKNFKEIVGDGFNKAFNEKTFKSFVPQVQIQMFDDIFKKAMKKGMDEVGAEKLAGDTIKNYFGLTGFTGRSTRQDNWLSALFFAPRFREGIINTLWNTGKAGVDVAWKLGGIRGKLNPALAKNRKLLAGMIVTYAMYDTINNKINGNHMWDNPENRKFALRIPNKTTGEIIYVEFMPSFLAFARNMISGGINLVSGDPKSSIQQFGSVFSIPIKMTTEILGNRDYFGNPIYKDTDDGGTKALKIAKYVGIQSNHPYVAEIVNQINDKKTPFQSASAALELPLKFGSQQKEEAGVIFNDYMDVQNKERVDITTQAQKEYKRIQKLPKAEAMVEAKKIFDSDPELYDKMKDILEADKMGLTDNERYIKILGTKYRAKYIYDKGITMTLEERKVWLDDLIAKKILTKAVNEELQVWIKK